jgi:hypothetical protein
MPAGEGHRMSPTPTSAQCGFLETVLTARHRVSPKTSAVQGVWRIPFAGGAPQAVNITSSLTSTIVFIGGVVPEFELNRQTGRGEHRRRDDFPATAAGFVVKVAALNPPDVQVSPVSFPHSHTVLDPFPPRR